ncbi:PREDICTED: tubulin-folding cofactor D-like [Nicotiana attenuata]|uniref:tubulin-folding cofactor D-like n=1 Tax=Nicotiana attenuata TaxID=49451 RepID=UPI000904A4F1|nr:PREDICTED: tubulin-folding cofactor D-like [Nicotiana attenuata]
MGNKDATFKRGSKCHFFLIYIRDNWKTQRRPCLLGPCRFLFEKKKRRRRIQIELRFGFFGSSSSLQWLDEAIEILFCKKIFLNMEVQTEVFCGGDLEALRTELKGSKDFLKLSAEIAKLGDMASSSEPINIQAFGYLLTFFTNRYPKIGK